jgi:hypothetical protein
MGTLSDVLQVAGLLGQVLLAVYSDIFSEETPIGENERK